MKESSESNEKLIRSLTRNVLIELVLKANKENKELKLELQKLQNDLDDALSFKNGKGPTAVYIASLRSELQKQKELNAELVKGLKRAKNFVSEGADMFEAADNAQHIKKEFQIVVSDIESLIKKSNEI